VSQQIAGASAPAADTLNSRGGANPKQVGLGSQLATIDTVHTQGSLQTTGRPLDLGISGDGFFKLLSGTETTYSRAGNFYLDQTGNIVNGDGKYLLDGSDNRIKVDPKAKSFSIGPDGTVNVVLDTGLVKAGQIQLVKFPNNEGLEKAGNSEYRKSANSGDPIPAFPGADGAGTLVSGALEMSNVDLSEEFTEMIVAQRGFQANTRIITTSDEILQELVNLKR
jgi:flagellar hook protein FlgE